MAAAHYLFVTTRVTYGWMPMEKSIIGMKAEELYANKPKSLKYIYAKTGKSLQKDRETQAHAQSRSLALVCLWLLRW